MDEKFTTFESFAWIWFETFKDGNVQINTARGIQRNLRIHIIPFLGEKNILDIRPIDLQPIFTALNDRSRDLQHKCFDILNQIFVCAVDNGLIPKNPVSKRGLELHGNPCKKRKALTPSQIDDLLAVTKGTDAYDFCFVALKTGLRKGEELALSWTTIDLHLMELQVTNKISWPNNSFPVVSALLKTQAAYRTIPFDHSVLALLEQRKSQSGGRWVFPDKSGNPMSYSVFRRIWRQTKKANLPVDFTPHSLRHTCLTDWFDAGLDIKEVQYLAGHTCAETTLNIYAEYIQSKRFLKTKAKIQRLPCNSWACTGPDDEI